MEKTHLIRLPARPRRSARWSAVHRLGSMFGFVQIIWPIDGININGTRHFIGRYPDPLDAAIHLPPSNLIRTLAGSATQNP